MEVVGANKQAPNCTHLFIKVSHKLASLNSMSYEVTGKLCIFFIEKVYLTSFKKRIQKQLKVSLNKQYYS